MSTAKPNYMILPLMPKIGKVVAVRIKEKMRANLKKRNNKHQEILKDKVLTRRVHLHQRLKELKRKKEESHSVREKQMDGSQREGTEEENEN